MATILVEILGEAKQFKEELDGAVKSTEKANSGFSKMSAVAGVAGLAVAGLAAEGLTKSVEAAQKAQEETGKLNQAFENAGMSAKKMAPFVDNLEASQRKLGFTNNDTRGALTKLVTAGDDASQANKDMATASDLARFKNESLGEATSQLIKVHAGNTRALKELGIVLPPVTTATDALKEAHVTSATAVGRHELALAAIKDKMATGAEAADILAGKIKGQATEFSNSSEGGMAQFHAQVGNIEEKIGAGLIPVLTLLISGLNQVINWVTTNWPRISAIFMRVFDQVKGDIQALIDDGKALFQRFHGDIMAVFDSIKTVIKDDLKVISDIFNIFSDLVHGDWSKLWNDLKSLVSDFFQGIKDVVTLGWNIVKLEFAAAWAAISSAASSALNGLVNLVKSLPGRIVAGLGDVVHLLYNAGVQIIQGLIDGITSKISDLGGAVKGIAGKITSWKGPLEVDRVLLVPQGQAIMQGLQSGIMSGLGDLERLTSGIAPQISANVSSAPLALAAPGAGPRGASINITINGWVGSDQQVAEKLRNELIRLGRNTTGGALGGFA